MGCRNFLVANCVNCHCLVLTRLEIIWSRRWAIENFRFGFFTNPMKRKTFSNKAYTAKRDENKVSPHTILPDPNYGSESAIIVLFASKHIGIEPSLSAVDLKNLHCDNFSTFFTHCSPKLTPIFRFPVKGDVLCKSFLNPLPANFILPRNDFIKTNWIWRIDMTEAILSNSFEKVF